MVTVVVTQSILFLLQQLLFFIYLDYVNIDRMPLWRYIFVYANIWVMHAVLILVPQTLASFYSSCFGWECVSISCQLAAFCCSESSKFLLIFTQTSLEVWGKNTSWAVKNVLPVRLIKLKNMRIENEIFIVFSIILI